MCGARPLNRDVRRHGMRVGSLTLPLALEALVMAGRWPRDREQANGQHMTPIIPANAVQKIAPEESGIFLYPPPFCTVQDELSSGKGLTAEQQAVQDIDPSLTVVIADFGLGSDTAVALDFRGDKDQPAVIRLQWRLPQQPNRWLPVARSFEEFWAVLNVA